MTEEQRMEKLTATMKTVLLKKKILNEKGYKYIDSVSRSLSNAAHGYYYIMPSDRENTTKILAERWFRLSHDPSNPRSFRGGRRRHSFHSFSFWVDSNYYVIALTRNEVWSRLLIKLLNLVLRKKI